MGKFPKIVLSPQQMTKEDHNIDPLMSPMILFNNINSWKTLSS